MKLRRRILSIVTMILVGVGAATVPISPARAEDSYWPYRIVNTWTGLCLAVPNTSYDDGVDLIVETCGSGYNQIFELHPWGPSQGRYLIRPPYNWKCVDILAWSVDHGGRVVQWTCTFTANQIFDMTNLGVYDRQLMNIHSRLCLAPIGIYSGAQVRQVWCGTGYRIWQFDSAV